jgi:hypothetical protein
MGMERALFADGGDRPGWPIVAVVASTVAATVLAVAFARPLTLRWSPQPKNDRSMLHTISEAIVHYRADNAGACPPTLQALVDGKYLARMPRDRWGHLPRFTCPGKSEEWAEVAAAGKDGQFGTGDDVGP